MPNPQSGFQNNTTIQTAWWIYKPDPNAIPPGKEVMIDTGKIQYIEATSDHQNCWLYFDESNVSTSQSPYKLTGPIAVAFLADMEGLF